MVKIVYLFHARSLIIAGNKGLIVHVLKETDELFPFPHALNLFS